MSLLQVITDYDAKQEERIRLLKEEVDRLEKKNDYLEECLARATLSLLNSSSKRSLWDENTIVEYGGKLQRSALKNKDTFFTFDGERFDYRSIWDSDEDIDKFIDSFPVGCIVGDRGFLDGYLTYFFTVKLNVCTTSVDPTDVCGG